MRSLLFQPRFWNRKRRHTHMITPTAVGSITAAAVFLRFAVSLCTVSIVVAHGQWNNVNTMVHSKVSIDHPESNIAAFSAPTPCRDPTPVMVIRIIGISNSFAGSDKIKARRMIPFMPNILPIGSMKRAIICNQPKFPRIHRRIPAGAATFSARPAICRVLSKSDRTRICPILGRRNGGISIKK